MRPGVRLVSLAVMAVIGAASLALWLHIGPTSDVFWSWANGAWMMGHHAMIHVDHFSYTMRGQHVVVIEWLYDLLVYGAYCLAGVDGPVVLAAVTALVLFLALWSYVRVRGLGIQASAAAAILLGTLDAVFLANDRALALSLGFLVAELAILALAERRPRTAYLVAPLVAVWINVHGSALGAVALMLVWCALASRGWIRDAASKPVWSRHYVWASALSVAALCVTPWGPGLAVYDLRLSFNPELSRVVSEWGAADFHNPLSIITLVGLLAVLGVGLWGRRLRVIEGGLGVVLLVAFCHTYRMELYALGMLALLVGLLVEDLGWKFSPGPARVGLAIVVLAGVFLWVTPMSGLSPEELGPVAAVHKLSELSPGRVFSTDYWSGWLIAEGYTSFIDGRTDIFLANGLIAKYVEVGSLAEDPDIILGRYHVRYVLIPPGSALGTYLSSDVLWKRVYADHEAVLFARVGGKDWSRWPGRVSGIGTIP